MTEAKLSYRKITEQIAGKLDLLEAYLFYCLALCSDCYTLVSHTKIENLSYIIFQKKSTITIETREFNELLWHKERRTD